MDDRELPPWVFTGKFWKTCTFEGLGPKKQAYLDSLTEVMAKKGFQRVKEIKLATAWESFLYKRSDLIFKSPDGKLAGVQTVPKNEDLRVGFMESLFTRKKVWLTLVSSIFIAFFFCVLSIFIIGQGTIPLPPTTPRVMVFIPAIIFLIVLIGALVLFWVKPARDWRQQIKQLLVEAAGSMGGKQITPFKKTTVELED